MYLVMINLFSLYLILCFMPYGAVGNIPRVHCKSMNSDVSFLQGSICMLCR